MQNTANQFTRISDSSMRLNRTVIPLEKVTSKKVYWEIVNCKIKPASTQTTWLDLFPFMEHIDWNKIHSLVYKVSKEPYLQSFQYKIINRTTNCRYNLWKWNITSNARCLYCTEIDTIEHHFYYCSASTRFWNEVIQWLQNKINCSGVLSVCEILFGLINAEKDIFNAVNFIILLGKWYINISRTVERKLVFSSSGLGRIL